MNAPSGLASLPASDVPADVRLKAGARNMLDALVRHHPLKVTRTQLGALAGFSARGGTFRDYLSALRRAGLVSTEGEHVVITEAGFVAAGATPGQPVTAEELRGIWRGHLKAGARQMLDVLIDRYPGTLSRGELAALAGFEERGGTFRDYLSVLRRNNLINESSDGIRAADVFFLGVER